MHIRTRLCNKN